MYEILNWLSQADKSYDPNGHWLYNKFNNKKTNIHCSVLWVLSTDWWD